MNKSQEFIVDVLNKILANHGWNIDNELNNQKFIQEIQLFFDMTFDQKIKIISKDHDPGTAPHYYVYIEINDGLISIMDFINSLPTYQQIERENRINSILKYDIYGI